MIGFRVVAKENRVKGDLNRFRKYLGKLTGDLLTQEACLTARAALLYAPPIVPDGGKGDTAAAGKTGERAIDRDVRLIFAPPGSTLQSVFSRAGLAGTRSAFRNWREKPFITSTSTLLSKIYYDYDEDRAYQRAKNLFYGKPNRSVAVANMGEMSRYHKAQRVNGQVYRQGRPDKQTKRYPYIAPEPLIKKYVKLRSRAVGKLKSGWWEIISNKGKNLVIFGRVVDAGAKALPKYITRHKGPGNFSANFSGHTKKVTITNRIGDSDSAGLRVDTFRLVVNHRREAIRKRPYQVYANRIVRNWNMMQRPNA